MIEIPKLKPVTFPSIDLSAEQMERMNLNFHARINGPITQRLIHEKSVVVACACAAMCVSPEEIKSPNRKREYVMARMLAAVYILSNHRMSLHGVGEYLGGKDHATILSMHRRYTDLSDINDPYLVASRTEFIALLKKRNGKFSTKMSPYQRKIA